MRIVPTPGTMVDSLLETAERIAPKLNILLSKSTFGSLEVDYFICSSLPESFSGKYEVLDFDNAGHLILVGNPLRHARITQKTSFADIKSGEEFLKKVKSSLLRSGRINNYRSVLPVWYEQVNNLLPLVPYVVTSDQLFDCIETVLKNFKKIFEHLKSLVPFTSFFPDLCSPFFLTHYVELSAQGYIMDEGCIYLPFQVNSFLDFYLKKGGSEVGAWKNLPCSQLSFYLKSFHQAYYFCKGLAENIEEIKEGKVDENNQHKE